MLRYCIVKNSEVTQEMATVSHCTSPEYMLHNDTDTIVMWEGNKPRCLYGKTEITNIKEELAKKEWQEDIENNV